MGTEFHFTTLPIEGIPQVGEGNGPDSVYEEFCIDPLPGLIVYGFYSYEDYSGYAYVLYRDEDGVLWEVEGSHCSCNGLEEQWSPGEVTLQYLKNRAADSSGCYRDFDAVQGDVLKVVNFIETWKADQNVRRGWCGRRPRRGKMNAIDISTAAGRKVYQDAWMEILAETKEKPEIWAKLPQVFAEKIRKFAKLHGLEA